MSATPSPQTRMAPTYAEGHTRNIHRCTRFAPTTPVVFHNAPGVVSDLPRVQTTPQGCRKHPRGSFEAPSGYEPPPGVLEAVPGGDRC